MSAWARNGERVELRRILEEKRRLRSVPGLCASGLLTMENAARKQPPTVATTQITVDKISELVGRAAGPVVGCRSGSIVRAPRVVSVIRLVSVVAGLGLRAGALETGGGNPPSPRLTIALLDAEITEPRRGRLVMPAFNAAMMGHVMTSRNGEEDMREAVAATWISATVQEDSRRPTCHGYYLQRGCTSRAKASWAEASSRLMCGEWKTWREEPLDFREALRAVQFEGAFRLGARCWNVKMPMVELRGRGRPP